MLNLQVFGGVIHSGGPSLVDSDQRADQTPHPPRYGTWRDGDGHPARRDAELMAGIVARDASAFDELRRRHEATLLRRVSSIVRNCETAQDLLQETLLRVWTKAEQWDRRGSVVSWVLQVATNTALNHLRTLHRRRETELVDVGAASSSETLWDHEELADPESVLEETERLRQLRALVDDLPEEKREIIRMVY